MKHKAKLVWAFILAAAVLLAFQRLPVTETVKSCLERAARPGPWGPAAFIAAYILACILFVPGSLLTLGAGALFGPVRGTLYISVASTLGAVCAFLIGRYLARDWVAGLLKAHPRFQAVDEAIGEQGWKIVALVRLSPLFPFNLLNYGLGLTRVSLKEYALASWLGMIPGTILYVYIGSLAGDVAGLPHRRSKSPTEWALTCVGLVATVAAAVLVARTARKSLEQKIRS